MLIVDREFSNNCSSFWRAGRVSFCDRWTSSYAFFAASKAMWRESTSFWICCNLFSASSQMLLVCETWSEKERSWLAFFAVSSCFSFCFMEESFFSFSFFCSSRGESSCCKEKSSFVSSKFFSKTVSCSERVAHCLVFSFFSFFNEESFWEEISSYPFFSPERVLKSKSCFCLARAILPVSSIPYFSRWKIRWSITRRSLFFRRRNSLNCPCGRTTVLIKSSLVSPRRRIHSFVTSVGLSAKTVSVSPSYKIRRPVVFLTVEALFPVW